MRTTQKARYAGKTVGTIASSAYDAGKLVGGAKAGTRGAKHGLKAVGAGTRRGGAAVRRTGAALGTGLVPSREPRAKVAPVIAGVAAGAAGAYFLDPADGKRRRHIARDKAAKYLRKGAAETRRQADYASGAAVGAMHEATESPRDPERDLNDPALARKVETEIFRHAEAAKGKVNVNAEDGIVYLRGEASADEIRQLVELAGEVDGVQAVESLLHEPGQTATGKDGRQKTGISR